MGLTNRGWDLPEKNLTLPKYLKQHGYSTHLIGLQHVHKEAKQIGYDTVSSRFDAPFFAEKVSKRFAKYLRLVNKGQIPQPFYFDVGFFEAHRPFFNGFFQHLPAKEFILPPYLIAEAGTKKEINIFAKKVSAVDKAVGKIMELVENSNLKNNTIIIFTTDHGWAFPRAKGTLYDAGLRTCFLMYWPEHIEGGKTYSELISNIDLFPTIAEIIGKPLPEEIQKEIQGQNFFPLISKLAPSCNFRPREEIYAEMTFHDQGYNPMRAVRTKKWKYIHNFTDCNGTQFQIPRDFINAPSGKAYKNAHPEYFTPRLTEELYNLEEDPNEFKNLALDAKYANILQELRQKVHAHMDRIRDPLLQGKIEEKIRS